MRYFSYACLFLSALALLQEVWSRRSQSGHPLIALIRDRFDWDGAPTAAFGAFAGIVSVFGAMLAAVVLGWAQLGLNPQWTAAALGLGLVNVLAILVWAAMEELIFRGALLPQLQRWLPWPLAAVISAVIFMGAHMTSYSYSATLAAIWLLDGLGFGIAYVGTRSLVASTLWHACKNLAVWMTGGFVFQFVPGLLRFASFGHTEHVRYLDLLFSAVMAAAALALVRKRLRYVV
jgi:membrane protease YdiL (CAAX protease family)